MKRVVLLLLLLSPVLLSARQHISFAKKQAPDSLPRNWHSGGSIGLNFTQSSFTNWAAGGENSLSGLALADLFVTYKKDSTTWENNLDLAYGVLKQNSSALRKTDDKIDFTSKYGRYAFANYWYYTALFGFKTQFMPGYNYYDDTAKTLISDFMSPAYVMLAIGMDYRPTKNFSVFLSPLTGRAIYVLNQQLADQGAFGVDPATYDTAGHKLTDGKNVRYEFGGYVRVQYKGDITENMKLLARLELFSNYLDKPQNVDVNALVQFSAKITKYINVNLDMQAIYDDNTNIKIDDNKDGIIDHVGPRLQFKQVLGIGFAIKF